jgi:hypothetical protein
VFKNPPESFWTLSAKEKVETMNDEM